MKKILYFLFFLIPSSSYAQIGTYEVIFYITNIDVKTSISGNCGSKVESKLFFSDGEEEYFFHQPVGDGENLPRMYTKTFSANKQLTHIWVLSQPRKWDGNLTGGNCKNREGYTGYVPISYGYQICYSSQLFCQNFGFTGYRSILPKLTIISPELKDKIPIDDKIVIRSHKGFKRNEYNWQYSLDNLNWISLPQYNGDDTLYVSAKDILIDADNHINQKIHFRQIAYSGKATSEAETYTIIPSAPHIESSSYQPPVCHGQNNGEIHIKFERALYDKERLYFARKNINTGNYDITDTLAIDPATQIGVIEGLRSGFYDYRLYGSYRIGALANDTVSTYTDGVHHQDTITIFERPKVVYTISQDSVHCHGGADGAIRVNAIGGVGRYYAALFIATTTDTLQTKIFTGTTRFENLKKGDYKIYLKDLNDCEPQSPDSTYQRISVKEPPKALRTFGTSYQEPKGFGYSDGIIWSNITGGTGKYAIVWKDSTGNVVKNEVLTPPNPETSVQTRVTGVKKGKYYLHVTDMHYNDASPATVENQCGCEALDSIFVDEPPKIQVEIKEKHYVTCHEDTDGELVAHAVGGRPDHTARMPYKYEWFKITPDSTTILQRFPSINDSTLISLPSAHYVVCVTDTNNVKAFSPIFYLVQPDPLVVTTRVIRHLTCSGTQAGEIEVIVTGGTKPYSYFWETGDTTRIVSGLGKGIYSVFVRDGRYLDSQIHYCSEEAFGEILSPNGMEIIASVQNPTCNSSTDGAITLTLTGGAAPYTYYWADGITSKDRSDLAAGTYQVTITDTNGCSLTENYLLEDTEALTVDVGDDFVLCKDRSRILNGSIGLENITYRWTHNDLVVSNDSLCTISLPGLYRLTVTNAAGCMAYDEFSVEQSDDELEADFVVASKIPNNTKVYAINIIRMDYDRIEWIIPDEAQVHEDSDERLQFLFPRNGFYTIGMVAHKGTCEDILYKTIEIANKADIEDYNDNEPFLKKFTVSPNPNDGNFRVHVELREKTDYTLRLYNNQGILVEAVDIKNSLGEETSFNQTGIGTGIYHLRFISAEATSVFKLIIK